MQSMVVGAIGISQGCVRRRTPSTTLRAVPLPVPGRNYFFSSRLSVAWVDLP